MQTLSKYIARCVFSLCCCLAFFDAGAQAQAHAQFDSNVVETGNPFRLSLRLPQDAGKPLDIDFSPWDSIFPKTNILEETGWRQDSGQLANDLTLIAFDPDTLYLPPLLIRLDGDRYAQTAALELIVLPTPTPTDPNDLPDIKNIHREPFHWTDALVWIALVAGILLLGALFYWLKHRKRATHVVSRHLHLTPETIALKKLEALEAKQLWQKGQLKAYYAELTYILREFLEQKYTVLALESTSAELVAGLSKTNFPDGLRADLAQLLQQADLVKFAKGEPPAAFHAATLGLVRRMVVENAPIQNPKKESQDITAPAP